MQVTISSPTKRSILCNVIFFEYFAEKRTLTVQLEGDDPLKTRDTELEPGDVVQIAYEGTLRSDTFIVAGAKPPTEPILMPECGHDTLRRARKVGGSFQAEGHVISIFPTMDGEVRYVFEFDNPKGMLHIYTPSQIEFIKDTK